MKKPFPGRALVLLLSFAFLAAGKEGNQTAPLDSGRLGEADKRELIEVLRLKKELGELVWPGLGDLDIPLLLFNEKYEFLVGGGDPPCPWQVVHEDSFMGGKYHRRPAASPQAFAVAVGPQWAGSAGTFELMNSQIPLRLSREFHVVIVLHEVFHAFQAARAPQRFRKAVSVYKSEDRYPYDDPKFSSSWNEEGETLAGALAAKDQAEVSGLVQKFLGIREARRRLAVFEPELIAYEHDLEWLEGLAKYAEVRFYELAASRSAEPAYASYRSGHPFWRWDLARLRRTIGGQEGDLRFYLSGAAQAMLLDRLQPGWKAKAFREEANLEDSLRAAALPD